MNVLWGSLTALGAPFLLKFEVDVHRLPREDFPG